MTNADFCLLVANMYIVSITDSKGLRFFFMLVWFALFILSVYQGN